jgi:hypothetical protein
VSLRVCLAPANAIAYPNGGGHLWVYLNWALALRAAGCEVIWLEGVDLDDRDDSAAARRRRRAGSPRECVSALKDRLAGFGLEDTLALFAIDGREVPDEVGDGCIALEEAAESDLLLNLWHSMPEATVRRFRRTAYVDTDPGLVQIWMSTGDIRVAPHDVYFTIGETVGTPDARFPDCGIHWHYTPPPVHLGAWCPTQADPAAPFTTVTHWWGGEFVFDGQRFSNEKSVAFMEYADLPSRTSARLELAVCLGDRHEEWRSRLEPLGWRLREAWSVSSTPEQYRDYIQRSRGEFSCVKPYCVQFANGWTSDRTICYLASGKPVVVQDTGPSRLPFDAGLFRFRCMDEAVRALETIEGDYERQCRLARRLAEEQFDGSRVVSHVLERALA